MRTHRLEVCVSKSERERIEREAAALCTSVGDYVRKAAMLLDAESREKAQQEIERMRTPEYREEVRREVSEDEAGLAAIVSLLGFAGTERTPSEGEARASSRVAEPRASWKDGDRPENGEESK
jgi:hypothetical protein